MYAQCARIKTACTFGVVGRGDVRLQRRIASFFLSWIMMVKRLFIVLWSALLLISLSQIFPIPPYAETMYSLYRSGYFVELDRQYRVIADAFLKIKMMSRPSYAWVFLDETEKTHGITVRAYNSRGLRVAAPGSAGTAVDNEVLAAISAPRPVVTSRVSGGRYFSVIPLGKEDACSFCHAEGSRSGVIGALTFERRCDSRVFYAFERIGIFTGFSMLFALLLFATIRWDPQKSVREIFVRVDKME